jgi:hypothetical protein
MMIPCAPRLSPCAAPIELQLVPSLVLPPSLADSLDEADLASLPEVEEDTMLDVPRAPKLRPAACPVFDENMPELDLPEAFAEDIELFDEDTDKCEDDDGFGFELVSGCSDPEGSTDSEAGMVSCAKVHRQLSAASTAIGDDCFWGRLESAESMCSSFMCSEHWHSSPPKLLATF